MKYHTGQIVEGKVTGIQPYGAFVSIDRHTTGLIHISEISDGFVKDINRYVHVGETVRVKIIDYDAKRGQARLSLKALQRPRVRHTRPSAPHYKPSLPPMRLGFRTIAENMDGWIKEAEKNILHADSK